jgi:hypothetical protein
MKTKVEENVIQWLLQESNPPVRYLTLKNLLNQPEKAGRIKPHLVDYTVTHDILQNLDHFLDHDKTKAYWKYKGKYWQLIFLAQVLADKEDPRVSRLAERLIDSHRQWNWLGNPQVLHCLIANLLAALMKMGYADHPVVKEKCETLAQYVVQHQGIHCTAMMFGLMRYCHMAVPKLLLCFSEIPREKRSPAVSKAISILVNALLNYEVYIYVPGNRGRWQKIMDSLPKRAQLPEGRTVKALTLKLREQFLLEHGPGEPTAKKGWLKFGFPLHYNSDILEAMFALARADTPMCPQLERPLQIIKDKRTKDGTWVLENSLNGKMWVDIEEKGKPSKWLTYFAMVVLGHFNGGLRIEK